MVLAICNFLIQAYTCFDSSQYWHLFRKRKGREAVDGVPSLPVVMLQQLWQIGTQTELDPTFSCGGGWPGRTVRRWHASSTAELWLLEAGHRTTGSTCPCTRYLGYVFLFPLGSHSDLPPPPTFGVTLLSPSLCIHCCAPPHFSVPPHCQQPLLSSALVRLALPGHTLPRAFLAPAPHRWDKSCQAHPELLLHQHISKLSPRHYCCYQGLGKDGFSSAGDGSPKPQTQLLITLDLPVHNQ